jgi:hypothetical protein
MLGFFVSYLFRIQSDFVLASLSRLQILRVASHSTRKFENDLILCGKWSTVARLVLLVLSVTLYYQIRKFVYF